MWQGIIHRYGEFFEKLGELEIVSLHEGNTPLIRIDQSLDLPFTVHVKYEGLNPSGSFKDRGMTLAISKAKTQGARAVICASTGNTAASAAAYAAKAGLPCYILVPNGAVARGKLAQAFIHGGKIMAIEGNFDLALEIAKKLAQRENIALVNSLNPMRLEGQKTAAFEICDQLGHVPSHLCLPVGNAGNITAYWRGFKEYKSKSIIDSLPIMLGFQAEGAAPLVHGQPVENPETVATAIRIGNPASWQGAINAKEESGGRIVSISDEEILKAYRFLAEKTGLFCEPASAISLAGLMKLHQKGYFSNQKDLSLVCILTGHGLKDPDNALKDKSAIINIAADYDLIKQIILEG